MVGAAVAGAAGRWCSAFFTLTLNSNQVATGLALTIFGTGMSSLVGLSFLRPHRRAVRLAVSAGAVAAIRSGKVIFGYSPIVYFALLHGGGGVRGSCNRTRAGLILRAVGENDLSAHSIGYSVVGVRYAAVAFGGAMAGIGGAYFSLVITPMWAERMTAGRGWIALALVVFAGWKATRRPTKTRADRTKRRRCRRLSGQAPLPPGWN